MNRPDIRTPRPRSRRREEALAGPAVGNGWQWVRLGDHVAKVGSGFTPLGGHAVYQQTGVPLIRSQNVHMNRFELDGLAFISPEQNGEMTASRVEAGDVLLNITGASIGRVCVAPPEFCPANVNQHVCIIRSDGSLASEFLAFYFASAEFQKFIMQAQAGGTRQALTKAMIENFRVPLAPLSEQRRIAGRLREQMAEVARARAAVQAQLAAVAALPAALLRAHFTTPTALRWPRKPLEEAATLQRGRFSPRPRNNPIYYGGTYPFIQTGGVESEDGFIREHTQTLNDRGLAVSKLFPAGTLVISIAANIGSVGILTFDSCMPDSLVGVSGRDGVAETQFLFFVLKHLKPKLQALAPQMAQPNLSLALLGPTEIPVPPLSEQRAVAARLTAELSAATSLRASLQARLTELERLPAALLRTAFNGQ